MNCIVTLHVDPAVKNNEGRRRGVVNKNFAAFRCKRATVVAMRNFWTGEPKESSSDYSYYDVGFTYELGEIVEAHNYNDWDEDAVFAGGIHYYRTEEAAEAEFTLFNEQRLKKMGIPFKMVLANPKSGQVSVKKWYNAKGSLEMVEYYDSTYGHCTGVDRFWKGRANARPFQNKNESEGLLKWKKKTCLKRSRC